jgi:hypothetical protein
MFLNVVDFKGVRTRMRFSGGTVGEAHSNREPAQNPKPHQFKPFEFFDHTRCQRLDSKPACLVRGKCRQGARCKTRVECWHVGLQDSLQIGQHVTKLR